MPLLPNPVDTGRKLNVHKTSRGHLGRLLNVLCTFNLRPVSTEKLNSRYQNHAEVVIHVWAPKSSMKMFLKFSE